MRITVVAEQASNSGLPMHLHLSLLAAAAEAVAHKMTNPCAESLAGEFADENEKLLKSMPVPLVAIQYYRGSDLYMCAGSSTYVSSHFWSLWSE